MKAFGTLFKNELKLNVRNMNMVIFAIIMPLVVLLILGVINGTVTQSFGPLCAISICAGGLMGLPIVVSEYRERKILKRFQVTPIHPFTLLLVELSIYIVYCVVSLLTLMLVAKLIWHMDIRGSMLTFLGSWLLTMISTLSVGMMIGGIAKNAKYASVIACILYFPMLLFSGATLPLELMPVFMQKIVNLFPLTQGIQLMQNTFMGMTTAFSWTPIIIMSAVTVVSTAVSIRFFKWE